MKKAEIMLNGHTFGVMFNTYVLDLLEDKGLNFTDLMTDIGNGVKVSSSVKSLAFAMHNCYLEYYDHPLLDEMPKEFKFATANKLKDISNTIIPLAVKAMQAEDDAADDDDDEYLGEARKNAEGGEKAAN